LFAEIHILPPTVPLCHCFGIGTWGRNGPFYAMYHATKTQKDIHVAGDLQLELHQKTLHYISQNYPLQALLVILWVRRKSFEDMIWKAVWPFVI
jgi:hypothetical protein